MFSALTKDVVALSLVEAWLAGDHPSAEPLFFTASRGSGEVVGAQD